MFKNPFSFSGRIRRLEYGLSYLLFIAYIYLIPFILNEIVLYDLPILIIFLVIPAYWFLFAQGSKRCHDLDNSGFYQLLPFYAIWLLFVEGNGKTNRYGYNPKDPNSPKDPNKTIRLRLALPKNKTTKLIAMEMIAFALLNTLFIVVCEELGVYYGFINLLGFFLSLVVCYFLLLLISNKAKPLPALSPYLTRHRIIYAVFVSLLLTIYYILFKFETMSVWDTLSILLKIVLYYGITYFPFWIYSSIFKKIR